MPDTVLTSGSSCLGWTFRTPDARNQSGRGGRTATTKFYTLRDNLGGRPRDQAITTQPYRPQTNGKVERFHQTMGREWAYGMSYRSHRHRNKALPHWLEHYNTRRPHSGIGNLPPIIRVHNLRGQDN